MSRAVTVALAPTRRCDPSAQCAQTIGALALLDLSASVGAHAGCNQSAHTPHRCSLVVDDVTILWQAPQMRTAVSRVERGRAADESAGGGGATSTTSSPRGKVASASLTAADDEDENAAAGAEADAEAGADELVLDEAALDEAALVSMSVSGCELLLLLLLLLAARLAASRTAEFDVDALFELEGGAEDELLVVLAGAVLPEAALTDAEAAAGGAADALVLELLPPPCASSDRGCATEANNGADGAARA